MRSTKRMYMSFRTFRGAVLSAAAFSIALTAMAACGELTGPESPSTPTGVVATLASATSATITWTPSPLNDGVISYSVFRNGTRVGESATTSYTDTGLAQQTTYVYSVAANCTSGIVSDRSIENEASTVTTVDITPPTVTGRQPPPNFIGVASGATVTVTFSEPMDPATINTTTISIRLTAGGAPIPATVTYNASTRLAELVPTGNLPNPASITATVSTGVKDLAGNALAAPVTWAFTTRDETPPTVITTTPLQNATGVSPSAPITVTFSETMDVSTITAANVTLRVTSSGAQVAGTVTYTEATRAMTFTPTAPLAQLTGYTLVVSRNVRDAAGNPMGVDYTLVFTTGDATSPTIITVVPANGATGVAIGTTVKVTFSEPMNALTITASTVTLKNTATGVAVPATVVYDAATVTATLTPTSPLSVGTNYTVTVSTAARDVSGNGLASQFISTFTTVTPDTTRPTVTAIVPASGATGVPANTNVQVTFSEPMDQATITAATITLKNTLTSAVVAAAVSYNTATNTATLDPTGSLASGTNYTVTITTGVEDVAGNALAAAVTSTFTTLVDATAPTILSTSPVNGAVNVAVASPVSVTFSEDMDPTTLNSPATNFRLNVTTGGAPVIGTVSYNVSTRVATFTPALPLTGGMNYTATVTTGAKDLAGNALALNSSFSFTTIGP